jgi:hypothetical protein
MKIRNIAATIATAVTLGTVGFVTTGGTAIAATITCKTTVTHHNSISATGAQSVYTLTKSGCGKNYNETETGWSVTAKGARTVFIWTKNETFPCWTKTEYETKTSTKGAVTTETIHSGNC